MPGATVYITVTNVNDNSPEFIDIPNKVDIDENVNEGTSVITVTAIDADNDNLTYSIKTPNVPFTINSTSGEIKSSGIIDRENLDKYILIIVVSDGKNTVEYKLEISVDDKNDNTPVVSDQEVFVSEDKPVDVESVIATVTGTDADIGSNAVLVHEITGGNEDGKFIVNMVCHFICIVYIFCAFCWHILGFFQISLRQEKIGFPISSN